MFRLLLTAALVLAASISRSAPQLLFDQITGSSNINDPVRKPLNIYFSVMGPNFGIARYNLVNGWTLIDAPPFTSGTATPFFVGSQVFFRGTPMYSDGLTRLYRVDGDAALELATATDPGSAYQIHDVNGVAVFSFADEAHGMELWTSDGTPEGTELLVDINPDGDSSPQFGALMGGYLYFSADDGESGRELWRTDGTAGGTAMVSDILPGPDGSSPYYFAVVNGLVVFKASDDAAGSEPWRSDGTDSGTTMLYDLEPGDFGSSPGGFATVGSWAYFHASAGGLGAELYRTNGTIVQFIADINGTSAGSYPEYFYGYDGEVYFQADDGVHGDELWKTDGTETGTELVCDCVAGDVSSRPSQFATAGGVLFFQVWADGGYQLWRTEGTTGTTELVEVNPDGPSNATGLIGDATYLYFGADDGTEVGHEPRRMTVATGVIELMTDLNAENGSNCEDLAVYGDDLLAFSDQYWFGRDLWRYDLATPEDSIELDDTGWRESQAPAGAKFVVDGDIVYFTGWQAETGFEVGAYDGSDLYQVDVIPGTDGCEPTELVVANGRAYFIGLTETGGNYGLYRLTAPPNPAAILVHEFGTVAPHDLMPFNSNVIFVAEDAANGEELWRSTNQSAARVLLDINPGPNGSDPQALTPVGNEIFFTASEPGTGRELWVTEGSTPGTHLVEDLRPGTMGSNPDQLTAGLPYLYCTAHTIGTGIEIFRATTAGMDALEIIPGPGSANPLELAFCGSRLRFSADDGSGVGREPWHLLGTTPTLVYDLNPGAGSSNPRDFGDHLGATYFTANNGTSGRELWRASGGVLNVISEAISPGGTSSQVGDRVSVGNRLYFVAENAAFGREIWSIVDNGGPADVPSIPAPFGAEGLELQAGPNPFGDRLALRFQMPAAGDVRGQLIDASGRVVARADFGRMDAGAKSVDWLLHEGSALASGVYFLRVQRGESSVVRKVLHVQ